MNSSESWKWKDVKKRSVHPTSVCIFCQFCTKDKDEERWEDVTEYNLLCMKHPTIRTIHPISGRPVYAYWERNQETVHSEMGKEVCEKEPTIGFAEEQYQFCGQFNEDGKCGDFKKVGKKEEKKRFLSIGEKD